MDVKYLHPIMKPVLYETATFELTAMAGADLLHEMLSLRSLTQADVVGVMQRVWKILINDPSQFPLYPFEDVETFSMNYVGPSLDGYEPNDVCKRIQNINQILTKAGLQKSVLPSLEKAYNMYFNVKGASGESTQKAFSQVQYSTKKNVDQELAEKRKAAEKLTREAEEILAEAKERTANFASLLDDLKAFKMEPKASSTPLTQNLSPKKKGQANAEFVDTLQRSIKVTYALFQK